MILGDPASFAIELEWETCPSLADDGERATWASIRIWCDDQVLTRYTDGLSVHESVLGPASPLAIWLGRSWPALTASEHMLHAARARDGHALLRELREPEWDANEDVIERWLDTHALQRARHGMLLPNVILWRRGDFMSVSWKNDPTPRTDRNIQYLNTGSALVPARAVLQVLRRFVQAVARKVGDAGEQSAARAAVERAERRISGPWHEQLDTIAARLGRTRASIEGWLGEDRTDPSALKESLVRAYAIDPQRLHVPEEIDSPVARAARSASPAFSDADHERLLALAQRLPGLPQAKKLIQLRRRLGLPEAGDEVPGDYLAGYERAALVRKTLRAGSGYLDIEASLRTLGCEIVDEDFDDRDTDGIALWTVDDRALVAANRASPRTRTRWGYRAMLAHELYHLLFDASDQRFFGECTSDWSATPSERAANAFAAELLLPKSALPQDVARYWTDAGSLRLEVADLCRQLGVGWELAVRQLQNRQHLPTPLVDALLGDAGLVASDEQQEASAPRSSTPKKKAPAGAGGRRSPGTKKRTRKA